MLNKQVHYLYSSSNIFGRSNKDEVGRVCGTHRGQERNIHGYGAETKGERYNLEDLHVDGRIIQWRPLIIIADNVINRLLLSKSVVLKHCI